MPPPERSNSYPNSMHTVSDADSISETASTFHSMNIVGFPDALPRPKSEESTKRQSSTPSLGIDGSFLTDKELPVVPNGEHTIPIPQTNLGRSRSPGRRTAAPRGPGHSNTGRLQSPNPRHTSRSPARQERRTQLEALSAVLGPDSVPHTAELDSIPCAGIRIPNGPFSGLLAWRLVVREHSPWTRVHTVASLKKEFDLLPDSDIRRRKNTPRLPFASNATVGGTDAGKGRRMSDVPLNTLAGARSSTQPGGTHARHLSEITTTKARPESSYQTSHNHFLSQSTTSLPLIGLVESRHSVEAVKDDWSVLPPPIRPWDSSSTLIAGRPRSPSSSPKSRRPLSAIFNPKRHSDSPTPEAPPRKPAEAVVTNFLFDTSLGHNTISRETLYALGLGAEEVDGLEASEIYTATRNSNGWLGSEMTEAPSSSHHPPGENNGLFGASNTPKTVSLYLQNATNPITFRLAPAGEPSRLGVQFLLETEVNVCTGDNGAAAIMWLDRPEKRGGRMPYQDVPRTVPLPKLSLKARVAKLFNLPS